MLQEFSFLDDISQKVWDAQILELIQILSEITGILNFDLMHLDHKDEEISELKNQNSDLEVQKNEEICVFK